MAFGNPITGGQGTLIRPAIKSRNYVPGVSGWSINRPGDAEFNNLTVRGVFNGTDYVINSSGEFFYSGTPALGNLVASIAPVAGTDAFGNHYLAGFTAYSATSFVQINSGVQVLGQMVVGVPDQADAAKLAASVNDLTAVGVSWPAGSKPNAGTWTLLPGVASVPQPTGTEPRMLLRAFDVTSCISLMVSGAVVKTDLSANPVTWQVPGVAGAPGYSAGWAGSTTFNGTANWGTFQYRLDAEDNVRLLGAFKTTGTTNPILTMPAAYTPKAQWPIWLQRNNGGTLSGFFAEVGPSGNFNILAGSGGGIVAGNEYLVNSCYPLGNIA